MEFLDYKVEGQIGLLTIQRPKALNALNSGLLNELGEFLDQLDDDRAIRTLIITGEGEKAFVAGADIKEIDSLTKASAGSFAKKGQEVFQQIESLFCPVIAVVNGFALGGGLELALSCDFIFASEKAKLGLPESTLGLIPGFGGTVRLARRVGPALAKQWTYSGEMISAPEAEAKGLVNKVFPPEELMAESLKQAELMGQRSPHALMAIKKSINETYGVETNAAMFVERDHFSKLFETENQKEGTAAFIEKRKPVFKDL